MMNMKKLLPTVLCLMLSSTGTYAQSKSDTLVVTPTPAMHCSGCENKIKNNIRFVKGTKKIDTSLQHQTVTIVYDGRKTTLADFEAAFKKIGYTIKKIS